MSHLDPNINPRPDWEIIQTPMMILKQWGIFHVHILPRILKGAQHYLSVHEDGFPIIPQMWSPEFLEYDYIGAPWGAGNFWSPGAHGIVGNRGFCLESHKALSAMSVMPYMNPNSPEPSDVFMCVTHRKLLEDKGVRFAPTELAERFSTEQTSKHNLSFGFHGKNDSLDKYNFGWNLIAQSER